MKQVFVAAVVVIALTFGAAVRPALAHTADAAGIIAAITALQGAVVSAIQQYMGNLLNMSVQQASTQATAQSEKIAATIAETARGQEVARAMNQLQRDAVQVKEAMQLPPFACQTLASSDATAKAEDGAREIVSNLAQKLEQRGLGTTNASAEASNLYSEIDQARKSAPVSAKSLLAPKTYSQAEQKAAEVFVKAVTDPVPIEKLPAGWENTPQGRAFAYQHQVYQQRMSLAQQPLLESLAARAPQAGAGTRAGLATADASAYEVTVAEIEKRVLLPDWKKSIMSKYSDPLPVLKEMALMMGQGLFIDLKQAERLERMEAIMATQLAMRVREQDEPKLRAQREAATRAMAGAK